MNHSSIYVHLKKYNSYVCARFVLSFNLQSKKYDVYVFKDHL